jgi:hypothetical protein
MGHSSAKTNSSLHGPIDQAFVSLFNGYAAEYAPGLSGVQMDVFDVVSVTVSWADINNYFANVLSNWVQMHHNNVKPVDAIWCDAANLDPAASEVAFHQNDVKIIVMGHTHKATMGSFPTPAALPGTPPKIYVSCRAWSQEANRFTLFETEVIGDTHVVQLKEWLRQASGPMGTSFFNPICGYHIRRNTGGPRSLWMVDNSIHHAGLSATFFTE